MSMNSEMAGKIMSAVIGVEEVNAAVAKELNATRSGIPLHKVVFRAWEVCISNRARPLTLRWHKQ